MLSRFQDNNFGFKLNLLRRSNSFNALRCWRLREGHFFFSQALNTSMQSCNWRIAETWLYTTTMSIVVLRLGNNPEIQAIVAVYSHGIIHSTPGRSGVHFSWIKRTARMSASLRKINGTTRFESFIVGLFWSLGKGAQDCAWSQNRSSTKNYSTAISVHRISFRSSKYKIWLVNEISHLSAHTSISDHSPLYEPLQLQSHLRCLSL